MDIRRLVRGTIGWESLEDIARELATRLDRDEVQITFMDTDNWSSIPFVVDQDYFVKVITPQNALIHTLFTSARNLGVITSGSQGFFDRFESPYEMAEHEVEAIRRIRNSGINAPEPIEAFAYEEFGIVVMEFLPDFRTLDELDIRARPDLQSSLFRALSTMHANDVVHGDLRAENVLLHDEELYFIDATLVREEWLEDAIGYDLACAIAILSPRIGPKRTVHVARTYYSREDLLRARRFLDFVKLRPDHDFDVVQLRGELEAAAD